MLRAHPETLPSQPMSEGKRLEWDGPCKLHQTSTSRRQHQQCQHVHVPASHFEGSATPAARTPRGWRTWWPVPSQRLYLALVWSRLPSRKQSFWLFNVDFVVFVAGLGCLSIEVALVSGKENSNYCFKMLQYFLYLCFLLWGLACLLCFLQRLCLLSFTVFTLSLPYGLGRKNLTI